MSETSVSDFNDSCLPARWAIPLLLVAFVAAVILHVQLLSPYFHAGLGVLYARDGAVTIGGYVGDEALYRLYAESLLHLEPYPSDAIYPPLYPLLLAFGALLSPAAPLQGMIVLNILAVSAVLFPTYALARQVLAHDLSIAAALVAGLLPASFIFVPALMSENLSTTLFVIAFWLAIRRQPATLLVAGLFGLVGAFCFLTKYVFLAVLPFIDAAFIFNQWSMASRLPEKSDRWRLVTLAVTAAAAGITPLILWTLYLIASGAGVKQALGLHVAKIGFTSHFPPLAYLPSILGLNGLAILASALPVLPALLVGVAFQRRCAALSLYITLLGSLTLFLWLSLAGYAWLASGLFGYPQPIVQRYFMMLVPIFIPLAFAGVDSVISPKIMRRGAVTLSVVGLFSLFLAILVQAGLYDRVIWPVPEWITVIWVGGCDVLYGALGFPVIAVTGVAVVVLIVLRLVSSLNRRFALIGPQPARLGAIIAAAACLAAFNVQSGLAGARFAWTGPFVAINAAHGRAITEIIGDRSRDPRPALVTVDPNIILSIEKSTGIKIQNESVWLWNLTFWSGRQITLHRVGDPPGHQPHYWVRTALFDAPASNSYMVGDERFQVVAAPW
jgi:hypothetical protein